MWITENFTGQAAFLLAEMQKAQLLMVGGFVMLGWVLARRQLGMRKRVNRDAKAANKALRAIREHTEPAVPLSDAPPETQRWQVALFDLQRELKAELDTRIVVVQSLMRQLDDRIEHLSNLENTHVGVATIEPCRIGGDVSPKLHQRISDLTRAGHTASEIADQTGLPLGDVELIVGTISVN